MRKARDFGTHPETETTTSDWGRRNPSTPKCCQCFGVKLPTGMQILQLQLGELPKVLMPRPDQILVPCSTSEKKDKLLLIPTDSRALRGRPLRLCGPKATKF